MMLYLVSSHLSTFLHEEKVLVEEHYSWQMFNCESSQSTELKIESFSYIG